MSYYRWAKSATLAHRCADYGMELLLRDLGSIPKLGVKVGDVTSLPGMLAVLEKPAGCAGWSSGGENSLESLTHIPWNRGHG